MPLKKALPLCWEAVSELSRFRTGLGGGMAGLPTKVWNAPIKLLNDTLESKGSVPSRPVERSPRQCIAPELRSPRNVWVVNGPFMGWKSAGRLLPLMGVETPVAFTLMRTDSRPLRLIGMGLWETELSGFPRSQARSSISPKIWQLAHA